MSRISNFTNSNFNRLKSIPPEVMVFPALCGYHAWKDYKNAPKKDKKDVLLMKLTILTGTCLGAFAGHKAIGKLLEKTTHMGTIKKDAVACIGIPLGGIIGGLAIGTIAEEIFPNIPELKVPKLDGPKLGINKLEDKLRQKELSRSAKEKLKNAGIVLTTLLGAVVGSIGFSNLMKSEKVIKADLTKFAKTAINITSIGVGAFLGLFIGDSILNDNETEFNKKTKNGLDIVLTEASGVGAFDAVSDRDMKSRMQRGFFGLISEVLIPAAVVLPTLYGLRHITSNEKFFDKHFSFMKKVSSNRDTQKTVFENAISIPLAVVTYSTGNWIGDIADKKVEERQAREKGLKT